MPVALKSAVSPFERYLACFRVSTKINVFLSKKPINITQNIHNFETPMYTIDSIFVQQTSQHVSFWQSAWASNVDELLRNVAIGATDHANGDKDKLLTQELVSNFLDFPRKGGREHYCLPLRLIKKHTIYRSINCKKLKYVLRPRRPSWKQVKLGIAGGCQPFFNFGYILV